jgi:dienelactone hydrolase
MSTVSAAARWLALALLLVACSTAYAADRIGVVLMHGKWGRPDRGIDGLARTLEGKGMLVATPAMPWGSARNYDADYPAALEQIEREVQQLKSLGATRIVIAGQSFGANAAIAYAASGRPLDAIVAIAPGHTPELAGFRRAIGDDVETAKAMVAQGKGDERASFRDTNQGRVQTIYTTPRIYVSYFDPQGLAAIPRSAAAIARPIPLLWVVGRNDAMYARGEQYAYARAPRHDRSRYLVADANHFSTPSAAAGDIAAWIGALP